MRTVGDVRNGANAIYSGASEIAMGSNDLSLPVLSSRQRLWKRPPPVWNNWLATVKQNAENARQASHLALGASETAQKRRQSGG